MYHRVWSGIFSSSISSSSPAVPGSRFLSRWLTCFLLGDEKEMKRLRNYIHQIRHMWSLPCLSEKMLIHNMHIVYLFYSYIPANLFLLANLHSPLSSFCFSLFPSSSSCQLAFRKKRKMEKSPLCEEFLERASRPQELINIELLDVSRDSITSLDLKVDLFKSIYLLFFSLCRSYPTFMTSTTS